MNGTRFSGAIGMEYDLFQVAVPHHDELQQTLADVVKAWAEENGNETIYVLEIGCGTGLTTKRILDADSRIHVVAVDWDRDMLVQAKQKLPSDRVRFEHRDIRLFFRGYGRQSFDVIASAFTLHNLRWTDRLKLLSKIKKDLQPGGLFVNADKYARDDPLEHWEDIKKQIDAFAVYDVAGRPMLRSAWTQHYLEDIGTEVTEGDEILELKRRGFEPKVVYRKGMEAIVTALKL